MATPTPGRPGRVFISYRRDDSAYPAGWLYDRLCAHLGSERVFKDVDSIAPGDDFVQVLEHAVGSCQALLVLIGDHWLDITDDTGSRRLDDADDFVRLEIETALRRGVRVVPILVGRAPMPKSEQLPDSLQPLTRRHAIPLSPNRFESDLARLLPVIDKTLSAIDNGPTGIPAAPPVDQEITYPDDVARKQTLLKRLSRRTKILVAAVAGVAIMAVAGIVVIESRSSSTGGAATTAPVSVDRLLSLVPSEDHCVGTPDSRGGFGTVEADCSPGAPQLSGLHYYLYSDRDEMVRDWTQQFSAAAVCPGASQSPQSWRRGSDHGSVWCVTHQTDGAGPTVLWTVENLSLLGEADGHPGASIGEPFQWWSAHYQ
jgi:hypothetical protein